ncbi:hypothetical protein [Streptomyces sp. NPDC001435]|uniref:hypothetical protein n=1 Tax=unclassified Streptomyces TaxID=2593676 RepID=UPI0036952D29
MHDCRVFHHAPMLAAGARPANATPAEWLNRSVAGYALLHVPQAEGGPASGHPRRA